MSIEKQTEKEEMFSILSDTMNGANFDDLCDAVHRIVDIANYHKQGENVIELPCKVGDTVYILVGEPSRTIAEFRVRTIVFGETHDSIGFANKSLFTIWDKRWYDFFGKIIFTTKEEAEKALERSGK